MKELENKLVGNYWHCIEVASDLHAFLITIYLFYFTIGLYLYKTVLKSTGHQNWKKKKKKKQKKKKNMIMILSYSPEGYYINLLQCILLAYRHMRKYGVITKVSSVLQAVLICILQIKYLIKYVRYRTKYV